MTALCHRLDGGAVHKSTARLRHKVPPALISRTAAITVLALFTVWAVTGRLPQDRPGHQQHQLQPQQQHEVTHISSAATNTAASYNITSSSKSSSSSNKLSNGNADGSSKGINGFRRSSSNLVTAGVTTAGVSRDNSPRQAQGQASTSTSTNTSIISSRGSISRPVLLQPVEHIKGTIAGGVLASSTSAPARPISQPALQATQNQQPVSNQKKKKKKKKRAKNTRTTVRKVAAKRRSESSLASMGLLGPRQAARNGSSGSYSSQLLLRLRAEQQQAQDASYLAKLRAAAATPINVVIMSGLFWEVYENSTKGCAVDGVPLDCKFSGDNTNTTLLDAADALYYHVPSWNARPRPKAFDSQLRLAMSLESSAYYEELDDPSYMCHFDAEMTYRHCSQVINWYSLEKLPRLFQDDHVQQVPFEEKLHAIAYVNSNCGADSGRSDIMRALMELGDKAKVPVHSYGACDRNMEWPDGNPSKLNVFSRYKFCVTMENSLRQDYVTEKLWDGLLSGCVPVYLGSFSARDVVPDPQSFIMYDAYGAGNASTPQELDALMDAVGKDQQRYEAMLAWKRRKPTEQPSELFRYLWNVRNTSGECFLCQFLARHRVNPRPRYTTCLFNNDWMTAANQYFVPQSTACSIDIPVAS